MRLKKIKNTNFLWLFVAFFVVILVVPLTSFAITSIFGKIISVILIHPFMMLLELEMKILIPIAAFNHFTDIDGVKVGWQALRDFSNMFFILILLIIAFATIIGVKSYGYKTLLSRLIIVAILV